MSRQPSPTRLGRDGCFSLDFLELRPVARSGHDFLQVHIDSDLLSGRVLLVPTFKTATA